MNPKRPDKLSAKKEELDRQAKHENTSTPYFEGMVEYVPEALIAIDNQHHVIGWNAAAERIYGWSAEELMGKTLNDFLQTEYQDTHKDEAVRKARESGSWASEVTQLRKDGARIPVWSSVSVVKDAQGEPVGFIGINRDISQQKRAEISMRESQQLFYKIFYSSPTAMVLSRLSDGRFVEVNESFSKLTGYTFDEVIGMTSTEAGITSDPKAREERLAALKKNEQLPSFDINVIKKSGEVRNGLSTVGIVSVKGEQFALSTFIDITERKQAEKQVIQMKRLYATLSQVNQTIVRVKDRAELYQSICDLAVQFGEFSLAWIGLWDENTGDIKPVYASGLDVKKWPFENINIHLGVYKNSLSATAIRTSKVVTSEDVQSDKWLQNASAEVQKYDYHSTAAVPFHLKGKTIGIVILVSQETGLFKAEEEVRLLAEMGIDISFALDTMETERTRRQWADAFENCAHGIVIGDPITNQIITCNPAFARAQGETIQELSSTPLLSMYAPQDREQIKQFIEQADRTGSVQFEANKVRKDGSVYPVQMDLVSVRNENGNLLYRVATQQDITERKRAEDNILAGKAKLDAALESITDAVFISDSEGRFINFNESFATFHKFKNKNECAKTLAEYPDFLDVFMSNGELAPLEQWAVPRALRGETCTNIEYFLRRRDTGETWAGSYSFAPIRNQDGSIVGSVVVGRDVTEQKQTEEALRLLNERFRQVMMQVNDIIWIASLDGTKILEVNQAFEKIYGIPKHIFELNPNVWVDMAHPDDRELAKSSMDTLSKNGRSTTEYRIQRPDGEIRWILDRKSVLYDKDGKPVQLGGLATDITERKRSEEAIRQNERKMKALVTSLDDIVFELDEQGTYLNIWTSNNNLLVKPSFEMAGRKIVDILGEEAGRPFVEAVKRVIASGSTESIEYPLNVIGGQRWFLAKINPILTQDHSSRTASMLVRDITERKQTEKQIQLQVRRLSALSEIDRAISSRLDIRMSLEFLLSEVLSQLDVDAASVLLLNSANQTLEYIAGKGFHTQSIRHSRLRLGEGLIGQVGQERKIRHISDLTESGIQFRRRELLKDEGFVEYFGVPLIAKGILKGVLEVFHRAPLNPDDEWKNYLETLGRQAAIAIDNAQLFEGMQQSNFELVTAYDATIAGWSRAMDLRDKETEGHSQRVTELSLKLAERMGISRQEQVHLRRGALLHDIGKLGVPDHILFNPGKLNEEEWVIMRQHTTFAYNMLLPIAYLRPALDIPYCHHEKWDGSGYPRGLKGEKIPFAARIFCIVDVWDALRSDRPYRAGWTVEKTRDYIREQSDKHFEPYVVEIFLSLLDESHDLR